MICPSCSAEMSAGANFCASCGSGLSTPCSFCGASITVGSRFCQGCGTDLAKAVPGLPIDRAKMWQDSFASMGWLEEPSAKWHDVMRERLRSIGVGANEKEAVEGQHALLFMTRLQDRDWKIRDFKVDGKKMGHGPSVLKRAAFGIMTYGVGALMVKRTDQTWVVATRDMVVLTSLEDKSVASWSYSDIHDWWVRDSSFGFSTPQSTVEFAVKKRASKLVRNIAINLALDGVDNLGQSLQGRHHDEARHMNSLNQQGVLGSSAARVGSSNVSFMEAVSYWLAEATEVSPRPSL